jgi:adenylate cyclase
LDEVKRFDLAYSDYLKQNWSQAVEKLIALQADFSDVKLYQVYLERIKDLREQELAQDWDGVFRHTSK